MSLSVFQILSPISLKSQFQISSTVQLMYSLSSLSALSPLWLPAYEFCDHGAPRRRRDRPGRRLAMALKVIRASTPLQWVPVWLCHCHYDFITLERRGREWKKKQFALIRHCPSQITPQPITGRGSIGSGWAGWGGMIRGREGLKMPDERQKNNWSIRKDGFCHFEKGCQRVVHSHLLTAISSNSGCRWHIGPSHHFSPILLRLHLLHHC